MHLLTFELEGSQRLGVLDTKGHIIDVAQRSDAPEFASMQTLIDAGTPALDRLAKVAEASGITLPPDSVRWLAPLPVPIQMRDFIAFEEHMRMAGWNGAKLRHQWGAPAAPAMPPSIPPIWYQQAALLQVQPFRDDGTRYESYLADVFRDHRL